MNTGRRSTSLQPRLKEGRGPPESKIHLGTLAEQAASFEIAKGPTTGCTLSWAHPCPDLQLPWKYRNWPLKPWSARTGSSRTTKAPGTWKLSRPTTISSLQLIKSSWKILMCIGITWGVYNANYPTPAWDGLQFWTLQTIPKLEVLDPCFGNHRLSRDPTAPSTHAF